MLKVPQYESQAQSSGYSVTTPQVQDTDSALFEGMDKLGQGIDTYQGKQAELEAESLLQEYVQAENTLLLTGDNPYFGTRGKDSVDRAQPTLEEIEKLRRDHMSRIKNPRAQNLLSRAIGRRITNSKARIQSRALDGQREWDVSLAETGVEQASEQIQLYVNDPVRVRAAEESIRQNLKVAMTGMPIESINEKAQSAVSAALAAGIMGEIERSPGRAQGMLDQYGDKLEPAALEKVRTALDRHMDLQRVAAATADIRSRGGSLEEQVSAARGLFKGDVKLQDELKRRLVNDYNLDKSAREENKRQTFESFYDQMDRGATLADLMMAEPDAYESLDAAHVNSLKAFEKAKAAGQKIQTDWRTWTGVMALSPKEFASIPHPGLYRASMGDTEYKAFVKAWKAAREKGDFSDFTELETKQGRINRALSDLGVDKDSDKGRAYIEKLQQRINAREAEQERKMSYQEMDEMISLMAIEGEIVGTSDVFGADLWDEDVRAGDVTPDQMDAFLAKEVPPADRQAIVEALQRKHGPTFEPTYDDVKRIYSGMILRRLGVGR